MRRKSPTSGVLAVRVHGIEPRPLDGVGSIRWPVRPAWFQAVIEDFLDRMYRVAIRVLSAIARGLDLAPDYFEPAVKDGNSVLRLLHYPPAAFDGPHIRAGAHEDINSITHKDQSDRIKKEMKP